MMQDTIMMMMQHGGRHLSFDLKFFLLPKACFALLYTCKIESIHP